MYTKEQLDAFDDGLSDDNDLPDSRPTKIRFPFMSEDAIMAMEPPAYIIDGWIPEDSLCLLYGRSQSLKSFAALHMAMCISHGMPWYGHEVRQGAVFYVAAEGTGGFGKRVKAWKKHFRYSKPSPFVVFTTPINLSLPEEAMAFAATLKQMEADYGFDFVMGYFDTMARCTAGSDESSNTAMGLVVSNMDLIRAELAISAVGVHHTGKVEENGPRGASALFAAVNTSIYMERKAHEPSATLTLDKQKDDEAGLFIKLTTEVVPLPPSVKGKEQSSVVLLEAEHAIRTATPRSMPGEQIDTEHADLVSIASFQEKGAMTVTDTCVEVFGNGRHKDRVKAVVPMDEWVKVVTHSGIRMVRRVKGAGKGENVEWMPFKPSTRTEI